MCPYCGKKFDDEKQLNEHKNNCPKYDLWYSRLIASKQYRASRLKKNKAK